MGGKTLSTSDTKLEALNIQSSAFGVTIPVLYGVNRIAGNLINYLGFKATPHTTSTGGKGGGVKTQNTTFTYSASVMMGLCHGAITGIPRIWRGKTLFAGGVTPGQLLTAVEFAAHPAVGGTVTLAQAATFTAMISISATTGVGEETNISTLTQGTDYIVSAGIVKFFNAAYVGATLTIAYQYTSGSLANTALTKLGLSFINGQIGQAQWAPLAALAAAAVPVQTALNYSGLAYVAGQDYDLGSGAQIENHSFEIQGPMAYTISTLLPDPDPALVLKDLLTNSRYGAGFPGTKFDGSTAWSDYCVAAGLLMSPALDTQIPALDFVKQIAELTNTGPVWSNGRLRMVPYGDQSESGNGRVYTPNLTPIYDLNDSHFLADSGQDAVLVTRKAPADAYNHVRIEFNNNANQYNVETAEAKDQTDIDANGLRSMNIVKASWITDQAVARKVSQLLMQRSLYVRATYEFKLPGNFVLLEPMDLVTLTDSTQGLSLTTVRIIEIKEENDGALLMKAEDFPTGIASHSLYGSQSGAGYAQDYNVSPGSVSTPAFFEAPAALTASGLEVWLAARGTSVNWGGCRVWVSMDGTNYRQIGIINGGSRYGTCTGPVSAGLLPVALLGGALTSGSAADAAALNTLCYVGGANPEYLAFQTAALTGALAYNLGGLVQGAYATVGGVHSNGDPFVRCDDSIVKSGLIDLAYIGKTISFKFTSFNIFGAAEESLSTVSAYSYTVTGAMLHLPPRPPTSFSATLEQFGVRLACAASPDLDVVRYEYRVGASWAAAGVVTQDGGTGYLWQVQTAGAFTFWVAAVDVFGNYSTPVSIGATVVAPTVGSLSSAITGGINLALAWAGAAGSFAIAGYDVRYGAVWATATVVDLRQTTTYLEAVKWSGSRLYWITAVDVKGNYGTPVSLNVTINSPGSATNQRADIVDNNALLYWTAPAIGAGQLAIDHYDVRKGATFAGGAVIGSNGNSTFTSVFEQASGTFTYWIAPVDSAGNTGAAVSIVATINQPPDYVLRNNYDSAFPGTFVNFYTEAGGWLGPVDTSQTWATHFTGNSWTTPDAQIAAGSPIYVDPSLTTGSYEETIDYGAALPSTVATATLNSTIVAGAVTITATLSWKLLVGDPWTVLTAGTASALIPPFRYLRVHYDFACTAGGNLMRLNSLNVKLAVKLRNDSGSVASVAVGGTAITFGYAFIYADTPIFQPGGSTPLIPVVIYSGGANPTGFTIKCYSTAGVDVGCASGGSWTARGY